MRNIITLCITLSLAAAGANAAAGVNWTWFDGNSIDIDYSIGSGTNSSLMIVDFQNGSYYAMEYKWDQNLDANDPVTGWDMLEALCVWDDPNDANAPVNPSGLMEYQYTDWGWGITLDRFSYGGNDETAGSVSPWPSWVYYLSDNSTNTFGATSGVGAGDRALSDGSWDGWSWHEDGFGTGAAPIPEPATLSLLAIGAATLLRRRR